MLRTALLAVALLGAVPASAQADSVDVTFRFLPDLEAPAISPVVRAFVPGSFNDWGPNSSGRIADGAPSEADFVPSLNEYRYTQRLEVGGRGNASDPAGGYTYKVHYHENASGSAFTWLTDPLGGETFGNNSDSVVRVADPMVFQIAREEDASGQVVAVSAGVFGSAAVASVTVTVNDDVYTTGIDDTGDGVYRLVLPEAVAAGSFVRVEATMAGGATASAEVGTIPPTVTDAPVPDGLADGINYDPDDASRAWLVLRAPGKSYVYALGSFNGWTVDEDALMFRDAADPLGTRWWIELTGLTPGTEYTFQYLVDGLLRVADPYTTLVYYPGEAGYPSGAVPSSGPAEAVGVLTPGATPFAWTDGDFEPPAPKDLVIYELLIRDFLREHSFTALTDTLDYLERLGVNAIELMPVSEFDGDESWGYNPAFHFALDKHYGTPDAFKAFVDAAHARGMAVILDVVYNHATGQSPLVRLDNQGRFGAPNATNPWANPTARHPFNVFNDLNHESPLTQIWLDAANRFWMDEYHVDGYRFDLSKGFTQRQTTDVGVWSAYDASRVALLKRMADSLWAAHPEAYVIMEHFGSAQEEQELAAYGRDRGLPGMMFWSNLNDASAQAAMGYMDRSSLTRSYPPNNGFPLDGQITFMESHDEQWMMFKNRSFGNASGSYNVRNLHTALDRQKLLGTFFFLTPGPRMLWQFGEIGYGGGPGECLKNNGDGDCAPSDPGRVGNKPIRWDYVADVPAFSNNSGVSVSTASADERRLRQRLYDTWAALLDLRNGHEIFRSADTEFASRLGATPARWMTLALPDAPDGEPTRAVVFGNVGVDSTDVTVPLGDAGTWYSYFDDTEAELPAGDYTVRLGPGEFFVWTDVDVPSPPGNLGAVADEAAPEAAAGLQAVFPNPAASGARVRFALAAPGAVRLDVLDALGRQVLTVADRTFAAGDHEAAVDVSSLPAGVYVVRLATEAGAETARLTVVR
ncbi:MAG: alpha-amylase family glycosyl hydrolase [Bacteroidota bacterium]